MGKLSSCVKDDILRHPGQLGYLQAVALAGGPVMNIVQEHDGVVMLGGGQVNIHRVGKLVRQLGQLEIVGGKQSVTPNVFCQMFGGCPGQ